MRATDPPTLHAILGPTNTGKTTSALERMLAHPTGVMGFPLRLLAREAYDRVKAKVGAERVHLLTGEERLGPPDADYVCATTEAMPSDRTFAFVGVDEIQLAQDRERGYLFTDRILHVRGTRETLLLGAESMRAVLEDLLPSSVERARPRLSSLTFAGAKKLGRVPPRSAIVAFRVDDVYRIALALRREKGGAAVVLGALSPRTRNAQVAMYQSGEVDYLVATDAIGMGLNLDVHHVAFAERHKFDGREHRPLSSGELAQIAGRAGRAQRDGTFGATMDCAPLGDELVRAIEEHRFPLVERVWWRSPALDESAPRALLASLEAKAPNERLMRKSDALDHETLRALVEDPEIAARATDPARTALLWACCQLPDFRDERTDAHLRLVRRLFMLLVDGDGRLPKAFLDRALDRLDDPRGDVDLLTTRISHIRTWAYVAHRPGWVDDALGMQERAREIEDRLSDALHAALTERFVDRVTGVLVRRTPEEIGERAVVDAGGQVSLDGARLGAVKGLVAQAEHGSTLDEHGRARARLFEVAKKALLEERVRAVLDSGIGAFAVDGAALTWNGEEIGVLVRGPQPRNPEVRVVGRDLAPSARTAIEGKLRAWARGEVARHFAPLLDDDEEPPAVRAVLHRLRATWGTALRADHDDAIVAAGKAERARLRARGVMLGALTVDARDLHRPRVVAWRRALASLDDARGAALTVTGSESSRALAAPLDEERALVVGYVVAGARAFRADLAERVLAQVERAARPRAPFPLAPSWLETLGASRDEVMLLLARVGFALDADGLVTRRRRGPGRGAPAPATARPDGASRRDRSRARRG